MIKAKKSSRNPVIVAYQELQRVNFEELEPHEMLELEQRMGKAIEQDRSDTENVNKILQYLLDCAAIPAETVPKGF